MAKEHVRTVRFADVPSDPVEVVAAADRDDPDAFAGASAESAQAHVRTVRFADVPSEVVAAADRGDPDAFTGASAESAQAHVRTVRFADVPSEVVAAADRGDPDAFTGAERAHGSVLPPPMRLRVRTVRFADVPSEVVAAADRGDPDAFTSALPPPDLDDEDSYSFEHVQCVQWFTQGQTGDSSSSMVAEAARASAEAGSAEAGAAVPASAAAASLSGRTKSLVKRALGLARGGLRLRKARLEEEKLPARLEPLLAANDRIRTDALGREDQWAAREVVTRGAVMVLHGSSRPLLVDAERTSLAVLEGEWSEGSFEISEMYVKSEEPLVHHIAVRGHPRLLAWCKGRLEQQREEARLARAFDDVQLPFVVATPMSGELALEYQQMLAEGVISESQFEDCRNAQVAQDDEFLAVEVATRGTDPRAHFEFFSRWCTGTDCGELLFANFDFMCDDMCWNCGEPEHISVAAWLRRSQERDRINFRSFQAAAALHWQKNLPLHAAWAIIDFVIQPYARPFFMSRVCEAYFKPPQ